MIVQWNTFIYKKVQYLHASVHTFHLISFHYSTLTFHFTTYIIALSWYYMLLLLFILRHEMAWLQTVWFGYHLRETACNKLGNRVTTHIWVAICGHIGWGCHVSNTIRIQIYVDIHHIPTKCEPLTFAAKGTSSSAVSGQLYRSSNLLAKVKRLVKGMKHTWEL